MVKLLTSFASVATIGFGAWHFFVPMKWNWYKYIAPEATELIVAVRAINVFFSLCMVLIGLANIIFVYASRDRLTLIVMLSLSSILWASRCAMQIIYPQGSMNPWLQYGMLIAFITILLCYVISLIHVLSIR